MIKITNGREVFEVTQGAFETIYKKQGFSIFVSKKPKPKNENKKQSEKEYYEGLKEKPISQWDKIEVKNFAEFYKIDISETKNVTEAKEIIFNFIDKN